MSKKTAELAAPEKNSLSIGRIFLDVGWRWMLLFIVSVLFVAGLMWPGAVSVEKMPDSCMGVPILPYEDIEELGYYHYRDYSGHLQFQNEFAAVDVEHSVVYLSQKINEDTKMMDLEGLMTIDIHGCQLYFAPDENWTNLKRAVADNHKFRLFIADSGNTYMQYDVVFTTLPVMALYGELFYKEEIFSEEDDSIVEDTFEMMAGRMILWNPEGSEYGVHTSRLQWNERGGTSKYEPKKPWRLSLKDWKGNNNNEDLLRLGSDDDWILNPMNMEDSNIREKMFTDLWNELAEKTTYNYPMSRAEYVEVLINGEYFGLCLLQRRMDDKYLELEENEVLVKAKPKGTDLVLEYFPVSRESLFSKTQEDFFCDLDCNAVVKENFVDVSLFLQMFSAPDNCGYKNMYYVFSQEENTNTITMVPWDTDMTMGAIFNNETNLFAYNYSSSVERIHLRREYNAMMKIHPDLNDALRIRWKELRQDLFSEENLCNVLSDYQVMLENSGSPVRDQEKWGLFYNGEDTIEKLYQFVNDRLLFLDEYYA